MTVVTLEDHIVCIECNLLTISLIQEIDQRIGTIITVAVITAITATYHNAPATDVSSYFTQTFYLHQGLKRGPRY